MLVTSYKIESSFEQIFRNITAETDILNRYSETRQQKRH